STLLKTIAGVADLFEGKIELEGKPMGGLTGHQIARMGVAYLPQTESVFTRLTVSENMMMAGYTVGKTDLDERLEEVLRLFPQISSYMHTKAQNLSGGERQMVAMGMALIRKPKMMMLDEPTANLSPKIAAQTLKTIGSLSTDLGITVLLVEQNARKALEMGDKAYLLVGGRNAFNGSCGELLQHKEFAQMYLGLKAV
ncbi:MAG: ATP-binding cassette domain-containing protein, partial [Thaumarchaeota archaeon]|nr:ATP-binding cassette domain-containing protein [Nitrososphaerota archaeon]